MASNMPDTYVASPLSYLCELVLVIDVRTAIMDTYLLTAQLCPFSYMEYSMQLSGSHRHMTQTAAVQPWLLL